jgi:hypothetical protein
MPKKYRKKRPSRKRSPVEVNLNAEESESISLNDLPQIPDTYIYLGHGGEKTLVGDTYVPANCTLSTIAESGIPGNLESTLMLCTLSGTHKQLVSHPVENYAELFDKFKDSERMTGVHHQYLNEGEFHVKLPGEPYLNKSSDFLFEFKKDKIMLFRSGLYNIATPGLNLPRLEGDNVYDQASITLAANGVITIANIKELYRGCVYPNIRDILENIRTSVKGIDITNDESIMPYRVFRMALKEVVKKIDVAQLMEMFPGNHYFFVCRTHTPFYKYPYENVLEQRKRSTNRAEAMLGRSIVKPSNYGWSIRAQQHFIRELQKVFIEYYPETDKDEVIMDEDSMIESLTYKLEDFVRFKGNPKPEITTFLNQIILKVKELLSHDPSGYVHLNERIRSLLKQTQQYDIERIELP